MKMISSIMKLINKGRKPYIKKVKGHWVIKYGTLDEVREMTAVGLVELENRGCNMEAIARSLYDYYKRQGAKMQ